MENERNKVDKPTIDPLHRIWIPIEKRDVNGQWVFSTTDGERYRRVTDGSIRHVGEKINGKVARKLRRKARHA